MRIKDVYFVVGSVRDLKILYQAHEEDKLIRQKKLCISVYEDGGVAYILFYIYFLLTTDVWLGAVFACFPKCNDNFKCLCDLKI